MAGSVRDKLDVDIENDASYAWLFKFGMAEY
jgi:hypothetical protein